MIISQMPLRVSLLGGGTDFPDFYLKEGGAVLTLAIDKHVYAVIMSLSHLWLCLSCHLCYCSSL